MKKIKILAKVAFLTIMISLFSIPAYAATGQEGYAVYRDGVAVIEWHAGLMNKPSSSESAPVIHAPGSGSNVQYDTWSSFLNGKTFKGCFKPKTSISSTTRDYVIATARELVTNRIGYTLIYQMDYHGNSGNYVMPYDIKSLRCDGVVEYCYEWQNVRIFGINARWDISKNDFLNKDHHSGTTITPKDQAQKYMTGI